MPATAYRLTPGDEKTIRDRLCRLVGDCERLNLPLPDRESLVRTGARAIGCTLPDLRDVEVEWIAQRVTELVGSAR